MQPTFHIARITRADGVSLMFTRALDALETVWGVRRGRQHPTLLEQLGGVKLGRDVYEYQCAVDAGRLEPDACLMAEGLAHWFPTRPVHEALQGMVVTLLRLDNDGSANPWRCIGYHQIAYAPECATEIASVTVPEAFDRWHQVVAEQLAALVPA
jgi:hypothetical protein